MRVGNTDAIAYLIEMKAGYWYVFPVMFVRADRRIAVRFDFDAAGVLRDIRLEKGEHSPMNFVGPTAPIPKLWRDLEQETVQRPTTRAAAGKTFSQPTRTD
jgi:hypothetical protein